MEQNGDNKALVTTTRNLVRVDWGRLLGANIEVLTAEERDQAFAILDGVGKLVEARQKELRGFVIDHIRETGIRKTDATTVLEIAGNGAVELQQKVAVKVDDGKLRAALVTLQIDPGTIFDTVPVVNKERLERAIDGGQIPPESVQSFTVRTESSALRVTRVPFDAAKRALLGV